MTPTEIRASLIEKTRIRMEEWTRGEDTEFYLSDNSEDSMLYPIVKYIDEHIDEAANEIALAMPLHRVMSLSKDLNTDNFRVEKGVGYIPIPDDFMRIAGVKSKRWSRTCYNMLHVGEEEYTLQQNRHSRGIIDKPQIAVAYGNIEMYSMLDTDTKSEIEIAKYIPRIVAEEASSTLYDLITLMCAIIVEGVFRNTDAVQILQQQLQTLKQLQSI